MFSEESIKELDEKVIRHTPNKYVKFLDSISWYWPVLIFVSAFGFYYIFGPEATDRVYTTENTVALMIFLVSFLFLPFYTGIKLGANLYRVQKHELTHKQIKAFDDLLASHEGDIEVSFVRKDGKIKLVGREQK